MYCIFDYWINALIMKKLIIFLSFLVILLTIGCQKEVVTPNTNAVEKDQISSEFFEKSSKGNLNSDDFSDSDESGKAPSKPITDPNHDEDEDDKTKK